MSNVSFAEAKQPLATCALMSGLVALNQNLAYLSGVHDLRHSAH
jgi:hypothetical protein